MVREDINNGDFDVDAWIDTALSGEALPTIASLSEEGLSVTHLKALHDALALRMRGNKDDNLTQLFGTIYAFWYAESQKEADQLFADCKREVNEIVARGIREGQAAEIARVRNAIQTFVDRGLEPPDEWREFVNRSN